MFKLLSVYVFIQFHLIMVKNTSEVFGTPINPWIEHSANIVSYLLLAGALITFCRQCMKPLNRKSNETELHSEVVTIIQII